MYRISKVQKRNGSIQKFMPEKLFRSINKSLAHSGIENKKLSRKIMQEAINILEKKYKGKTIPVEVIKQTAGKVLVKNKLPEAARFYLLHRYL